MDARCVPYLKSSAETAVVFAKVVIALQLANTQMFYSFSTKRNVLNVLGVRSGPGRQGAWVRGEVGLRHCKGVVH